MMNTNTNNLSNIVIVYDSNKKKYLGLLGSYTNNKNNAVMYKKRDAIGLLKCNKNLMVENAGWQQTKTLLIF